MTSIQEPSALPGALLVAAVNMARGGYLGLAGGSAPAMELARATLAGLLGVGVATLLQQRFSM